jgi:hypothetical protein
LQPLRIEDLLRYAFSGALFFFTLVLTRPLSCEGLPQMKGIGDATLFIGMVLLAGSLTYTVHRASTFPFLFFPLAISAASALGAFPFERAMLIPFRYSKAELELDQWRYELRRKKHPLSAVLADWGAQVHFLYCSGLAILLALLLNKLLSTPKWAQAWCIAIVFSALVLGVGLVHNIRLLVMAAAYRRAPQATICSADQ